MHYHLELIMPPTDDVESALETVLNPFREEQDDNEDANSHPFWDYYVIGGRWSGEKIKATLDRKKLDAFWQELTTRGVTVSGIQFGKQEISPAHQIPAVDALWWDYFPEQRGKPCLLFQHAGESIAEVCKLSDMPFSLTCSRLIVAGPERLDGSGLEANFMLEKTYWNGVAHQETVWDGLVTTGLAEWAKKLEHYNPTYAKLATPGPDWLVVTIDYHS